MAFILGRDIKFFLKAEALDAPANNYGASTQPPYDGADNGARIVSSSMDFTVARENRNDQRATRSAIGRITGKQEVSWSVETYMCPKSGTVPNIAPLLECALGTIVSTTYSLASDLKTLQMMRLSPSVMREEVFGAWVDEMVISASGGDPVTISFSGGACEYALTGTATTGTGATSADMPVTANGTNFMPGSRIAIAGLTAADGTVVAGCDSATAVRLAASTAFGSGVAVTPHTPDGTYATHGDPVTGISGSVSLDGSTSLNITAFDITLNNGIKPLSDEAFEKGTTNFIEGFRTVTGSVTVRATSDSLTKFMKRYRLARPTIAAGSAPVFTPIAITVTYGGVASHKQVVTLPSVELEFAGIEIPEAEEATITIPFTALATSSNNEMTFAWNQ
tara:strand:- start:199 stop:1377 length:1179 start_codon:yes stop_codon:yes gene_type:complete